MKGVFQNAIVPNENSLTINDAKSGVSQLEYAESDQAGANGQTDYSGARAKTDPAEIALVRKLDRRILPMIWAMYFLNYLDRSAIASARLNNLEKDLNLKGSEYNTCISVLFAGYLVMQLPSNMLMASSRVRPSLYMGICMALWGVVSGLTALSTSYTSLVVLRFFLGVVEAPFYPGAIFMLSIFYTRKEVATRLAVLYTASILSTAFSGLIAAAIFSTIDGAHGLRGWRWLFIIEGILTVVTALVAIPVLPNHPLTTNWLTPEERKLAHERICRDTVEQSGNAGGSMASLKNAFSDPRLYVLALMQNLHLSANAFTNFFPTVVGSLKFNHTITLVLTCPPFIASAIVAPLWGISSGRFNERTWHITGGMGLAMIGFIIAASTLNIAARYVACFCFAIGVYAVNSCILGWASATLGQTMEKKAISLGFINIIANASYIYTPYLFPQSDGPQYVMAMGVEAGFTGATIICAWGLKFWIMRMNRRLQRDDPNSSLAYAY